MCTDMEGVAGVMDSENWCLPTGRYYEQGKRLLTREVNAAVEGFFDAGASEILVMDAHGYGGIDITWLDPRVKLARGWPWVWPFSLDPSFDAVAWVGQHAKAGSENAHIAHTQSFEYVDLTVNGVSIGEFGQMAMCASELGVRSIFASGDEALEKEASGLVFGIETVAVKSGVTLGSGDELAYEAYAHRNLAAVHIQPRTAREMIRSGAKSALLRAMKESFGILEMSAPYVRVARLRAKDGAPRRISREQHPSSLIELLNMPFEFQPDNE
jgi:D-amino peptidase